MLLNENGIKTLYYLNGDINKLSIPSEDGNKIIFTQIDDLIVEDVSTPLFIHQNVTFNNVMISNATVILQPDVKLTTKKIIMAKESATSAQIMNSRLLKKEGAFINPFSNYLEVIIHNQSNQNYLPDYEGITINNPSILHLDIKKDFISTGYPRFNGSCNMGILELNPGYTYYISGSFTGGLFKTLIIHNLPATVNGVSNTPNLEELICPDTYKDSDSWYNSFGPKLRYVELATDFDVDCFFLRHWNPTYWFETQERLNKLNLDVINGIGNKIKDHSTDGITRTISLGYVTKKLYTETINLFNLKGWTVR